jgi:PAS domain S-box-containing protein
MFRGLQVLLVGEAPLLAGIAAAARKGAARQVELSLARDAAALAQTLGLAPWDLVVVGEPVPDTDPTRIQETVGARWPGCPVVLPGGDSLPDPTSLSPRSLAALMCVLRLLLGADRAGPGGADADDSRAFGDGVPLGLYRTTPDGRILELNQGFVDILGYPSRETLLAENAAALYTDPLDRERLKQLLLHREVLQGYETQLRRYDGRAIWVELSLRAFRDRFGAITHFEGAIEDVTERKLAEEALWDSEMRLRLLAEQMPALLWCVDQEQRFTLCIGAGLAGLGLRSNQVVGQSLAELLGTQDPTHPALVAHRQALAGESVRFDMVVGGRVFRAYVEALRQVEGGVAGTIGVALDVTESQRGLAHRSALQQVAELAHTAESLDQLYAGIHRIVGELMPARNFYIALYDDESERLTFPYFVDEVGPLPQPRPLGRGLTEYVLRHGDPLLVTPEVFDELRGRGEVDLIGGASVDWLGVPLRAAAKTIGVMVVQSYTDQVRYGEAERDLLAFFSEYVAGAIERRRAERALKRTVSLLESTLDSTSDGILVVGRTGKVVSVNRRFGELWRVPAELLSSRDGGRLRDHMRDRASDPETFLARLRQLEERPEAESTDVLELRDGRRLERHSAPQRVDGDPVGRLFRFRDVTGLEPGGAEAR